MVTRQKTTWYLFARDSRTREIITDALLGLNSVKTFSTLECADGVKRELCEVPDYAFVARFVRSKKDLRIDFEVFRKYRNGLPSTLDFLKPKKQNLKNFLTKSTIAFAANREQ